MSPARILVVPGGTRIGAVALANAAIHKLVELHEERLADPGHPAPRTLVALRDPDEVPPSSLRQSAATPAQAFPAERFPALAERIDDPSFFEGVDLIVSTSGSTSGSPRLVGLSIESLVASANATHRALKGPGRWILALPAHHIAGAMVLVRAAVADTAPLIVDSPGTFDPKALLPAIAGATQDQGVPGYLSLVPTQLAACLEAGEEVLAPMRALAAILVGGAATRNGLLERAEHAGLKVVTTYGMTETCGGCVYDGVPLEGVQVRAVDRDGSSRLAISGPVLMTRYLDADPPFFDEGGSTWLLTGDLGVITGGGLVRVEGRADDVIVTGGLSVAPGQVLSALLSAPGIADAWVTSTPDEKWGEIVTAIVVPAEMPTSPEQMAELGRALRDHVGSRIGRAYAPRRVVAADALPSLNGVKIDRIGARRIAEDEDRPERDWRR